MITSEDGPCGYLCAILAGLTGVILAHLEMVEPPEEIFAFDSQMIDAFCVRRDWKESKTSS